MKGATIPPPVEYDKNSVLLLGWDEDAEDAPAFEQVGRIQNMMSTNPRGEAD